MSQPDLIVGIVDAFGLCATHTLATMPAVEPVMRHRRRSPLCGGLLSTPGAVHVLPFWGAAPGC